MQQISAFDFILGTIPFKGQVLNQIATWWFDKSRAVASNHMLNVTDPNIVEVVESAQVTELLGESDVVFSF